MKEGRVGHRIHLPDGFLSVAGAGVVNRLIAFFESALLARILTPEEYGTFSYAWNLYSLVLLCNGLGVASAALQMGSEQGDRPEYVCAVCRYAARVGLAADAVLAAVLVALGLWAPLTIEGADILLRMLCLLPGVRLLYDVAIAFLRAQNRQRLYALLSTGHTVLTFMFCILGAVFRRERGTVIGHYAALSLSVAVAWFVIRREGQPVVSQLSLAANARRSLLSIAVISMAGTGLSELLYLLDMFVLGILDPRDTILAGYRVAALIPSAMTVLSTSLAAYLYPCFARRRDDGRWCLRHYKMAVGALGAVYLCVLAVVLPFAPQWLTLFFGENYADMATVFRVLVCGSALSGTFRILSGNLLATQRKLRFNLVVAVLAGIVNIVADCFLIQRWGALGAALATLAVIFLTGTLNTAYLLHTFHKKVTGAIAFVGNS